MHTEVFIEGQQVDISEEVAALFTYAVDDVRDFGSRQTKYSKTIVLPGSGRNNQIFGHAFEFTGYNPYESAQPNVGSNFNAAKSAACIVLVYGIQVFKGVLRLMEIKLHNGGVEYETAVFGELGGLLGNIGNRKLTGNTDTAGAINISDDLDFSDYDQVWSFANIIQSWADLDALGYLGYGVYFPLIDYGLCTTNRVDYSYQAMRPALYVHEYLVKIFEKAGYTYDCPFFETDFFKRLIVPHNGDTVYKHTRVLVDYRQSGVMTPLVYATTPGVVEDLAESISFPDGVVLNHFTVGGLNTSFTYAVGQPTGPAQVTVPIKFYIPAGVGNVLFTVELLHNGVPVDTKTFNMRFTLSWQYPVVMLENLLVIAPGDVFAVHVTASYPGALPVAGWELYIENARIAIEALYEVVASASQAALGDTLSINNCIPKDVLQRDFLLSIIKMFGLYVIEDPQRDRHVQILTFAEYFNNNSPLDWSEKVDRSRPISLKPMSESNARYFNFLYEKDGDYDNETYRKMFATGYGDRSYDAGLDFVQEKKDLKIIFAATPIVGDPSNDKPVSRIMKMDGNTESRTESKIRILQAKRIAVASWGVLQEDLTTLVNNTTYYGYAGHVDDPNTPQNADLNFGAPAGLFWSPTNPYTAPNVFNAFYSAYMAEITDKDSKLLTCYLMLSPIDILNLNFARAVQIDGQLFRLNRVIDYDAVIDEPTKTELLKVINLSY